MLCLSSECRKPIVYMGIGKALVGGLTFKMYVCPYCARRKLSAPSHINITPDYEGSTIANCFEQAERDTTQHIEPVWLR